MLDRQKVETILNRRFPGATPSQIAAAANAIMGLSDEWEEIADRYEKIESGIRGPDDSRDDDPGVERCQEFRLFRRRQP